MKITLEHSNRFLLFLVLLTAVLYYGRPILVPFVFAILLAMLMAPLVRKLDSWRWPRGLSSTISVLILLIVLLGMLTVISAQVASFAEDLPEIERRGKELLERVHNFINESFGISPKEQELFMSKQLKTAGESAGNMAGIVLGGIAGAVANIAFTLVLTFLMLYGKEKYEIFFVRLFSQEDAGEVKEVISNIGQVSQQYLIGRVISMSFQAVLFSVGLLIIGIENAILLGVLAGVLSIVPYLGPYLGGIFPLFMALITEDSIEPAFWVFGLLVVGQAIDNYFIEPAVVGGKVNLSALSTFVIMIVGGLLWGAVGMILFIPMLGIVKIIFDHVNKLKVYAYLIGDIDGHKNHKRPGWKKWLGLKK